jgi:hypothetical protein
VIDEHLLEALRDALAQRLRDPCDASAREVRRALHALALAARQQSLHAEELIVALKQVWRSIPQVQETEDSRERARLMELLVTLCIEEYYERS